MDENEALTDSEPAATPETDAPTRRTRGWLGMLIATLVILVILAIAAWFGWHWWQNRGAGVVNADRAAALAPASTLPAPREPAQAGPQATTQAPVQHEARTPSPAQAREQALAELRARVGQMEQQARSAQDQRARLQQRLATEASVGSALRAQTQALSQRVVQLENAVAQLSRQRLSAHDAMLLDDAETLLRLGRQRYQLFGDGQGALQAYTAAAQALAAVDDPIFADVRQAVEAERAQLAATHPATRQSALAALQRLRGRWNALPLKSLDQPTAGHRNAWQRAWHALANVIRVDRVPHGANAATQDPAVARQLGRLDLAEAQAALLASDSATSHAALERAQAIVEARFDGGDAGVQQAQATLKRLLAQTAKPTATVQLGTALEQLEDLRAVHAIAPAANSTVAPAAPTLPAASRSTP